MSAGSFSRTAAGNRAYNNLRLSRLPEGAGGTLAYMGYIGMRRCEGLAIIENTTGYLKKIGIQTEIGGLNTG